MSLQKSISTKRQDIIEVARRHGAKNIRVFGSMARGTSGPDSDVDFLVDLDRDRSLMDLGGLLMDLQSLLGRRVDVVTEKGLHWYIRDKILKEARPI
ncbi:MAG: nucleotidyltransferase [Desulfobulbaceae bacterium]|nr:nucleotidyltransferase [Desulfobulbaceae bacterium]